MKLFFFFKYAKIIEEKKREWGHICFSVIAWSWEDHFCYICFMKKKDQRRNKYIFLGVLIRFTASDYHFGIFKLLLFAKKKKTTLILPKKYLKLISTTHASFWLKTYLLCLVEVFFNGQSPFLRVPTVLQLYPLFARGRLDTGASQEKRKEASPIF